MKIFHWILILIFVFGSMVTVSLAQEPDTQVVAPVDTTSDAKDGIESENSSMSGRTLLILGFGLFVLLAEVVMIKLMKARWTPYSVIRIIGLTLIIIAALTLAVNSGGETQISAVIGLLGTLAGYLLGKDSKEKDVMNVGLNNNNNGEQSTTE